MPLMQIRSYESILSSLINDVTLFAKRNSRVVLHRGEVLTRCHCRRHSFTCSMILCHNVISRFWTTCTDIGNDTVFDGGLLRNIFGPISEEVTGVWS